MQNHPLLLKRDKCPIRQDRNKKEIVINEKNKSSYFEIKLLNIYGKNSLLSSLKGKVVLLDKAGSPVARDVMISDLNKEIMKLL